MKALISTLGAVLLVGFLSTPAMAKPHKRSPYGNDLPPGLAKRNGNLPPGLQKHLYRTGHLPPGLEKRYYSRPQYFNTWERDRAWDRNRADWRSNGRVRDYYWRY